MAEERTLHIFTAEGCSGCEEVKEAVEARAVVVESKFGDDVRLRMHDILSEEDYPLVEKYGLEAVPSAYLGVDQCSLGFDEETGALMVVCPASSDSELAPPTSEPGESSYLPDELLEAPLDDLTPS